MKKFSCEPIGRVRRLAKGPLTWDRPEEAELVLRKDLAPALAGIGDFSHLYVLFAFHRVRPERRVMTVRPEGMEGLPDLGVLASCSPLRPAPIGMTLVRLLEARGTTLRVADLDAQDGSPVLDIKPLMEATPAFEAPEWLRRVVARFEAAEAERRGGGGALV